MKSLPWMWILALVIIVALGAWWYGHGTSAPAQPGAAQTSSQASASSTNPAQAAPSAVVEYTDNGFTPATVTVSQGGSVTFVNDNDNYSMWVMSDPYPTGIGYDGTDLSTHCAPSYTGALPFDSCTVIPEGGTFVYTFDKTGTWGYNNHSHSADQGTVIVK